MPRIDPLQLLKCLSVLLSPEGGIMSKEEVPRLVNLMTKFSKKLVSKCVYLLILKSTDVTLVDLFMTSGGWLLIHTWLQEAMAVSNWNLVQEVLELLLLTPVDSSRLRLNNIPKLVKTLSKREDLGDVKEMAALLVNNWLAIVKNSTPPVQESDKQMEKISETPIEPTEPVKEVKNEIIIESPKVANEIETVELKEAPVVEEEPTKMEVEDEDTISTGMFYKITVRDGKQVITKLATTDDADEKPVIENEVVVEGVPEKIEENNVEIKAKQEESKSKSSSSSSSKSKGSSSSSSKRSSTSSSSKSSSSSKDKDKKSTSSSRHSSKSSSSSRDKEKERSRKDKDKENDKDKDKQRSNGMVKHSSSNKKSSSSSKSKDKEKDKKDSKEPKEKQAEKDKDTLAKIKPATLDKLGRIPKKIVSTSEDKEIKKPSISIEPKKKAEDRPKTVKIFNSKMRSTGLEEEVKPPPPRNAVKKPPPVIPAVFPLPTKRPSPPRDPPATPPEKKLKIDIPERVGAIKLIPPKPKPPVLLESDIFMDALTAATSKKEPKKRKRRLSMSKDSPENSPTVLPATATSPIGLKNFSPANFYQDTLEATGAAEETKDQKPEESTEEKSSEETAEEKEDKTSSDDISEVNEPSTRTNSDGLRGVLVYLKKKGPKRSIRWKDDKDLVEIKYFELDETERVNVSRTNFTDMAKMEMTNEREALMGRKLMNEDLMEPTTLWRIPYLVDQPELPVQPGSKSLEKDIQYAREKNILQALYFNKSLIPDSPADPIPETHPMIDPVIIPLEDAESQNYDLRNTPWPEPKGMAPVEPVPVNMPPMFQAIPGPFPNFPQMGPQGFPGMQAPGFCPPNIMPNGPPNMMPNNNMNMMGNPNMNMNMGAPMDMMNQGPINPNMFGPAGMNMETFNPMMTDNQSYPMHFNQPNMYGPPPPPNNNFNNMDRGGGHRGRGGFRRGNNNNNWGRNVSRGGNTWRNNRDEHRGGTGRLCKNIKNHGYCRNIETCPFVHPNNN